MFMHKKYGGYSHENHVTRMRCQNSLKDKIFQNIILSVAGSGVIEKITLKSVLIYESRLFRLTWICLRRMSARSAILKILETTWVSRKIYRLFRCLNRNAKTSVQITFLTNLTGILLFLTYNHHVPCKKWCHFLKKSPSFTILAGSKSMVFLVAQWKQYAWMKLRLRSTSGHQYGGVVDQSCCRHEYVGVLRSTIFHQLLRRDDGIK